MDRIQSIFAAGIRPQGFVLVHEAPKLLQAPSSVKVNTPQTIAFRFRSQSLLPRSEDVLKVLGVGIVALSGFTTVAISAIALMTAMVVPVALTAGAILLDPILVAVTEDGYWVEIDRWWTDPNP
jgi:hypothetical protein